jgi:hypothetical protein
MAGWEALQQGAPDPFFKEGRDRKWRELIDKLYPHLKEFKDLPWTIKIEKGANGWFVAAYKGDGSKPGSLGCASGGYKTPEQAFNWLPDYIKQDKHNENSSRS